MIKSYLVIGLALITVLALFAIYRTGYNAGRNSVTVAIQEKTLKQKDKLDEIRNNRPDASGTIKRLRGGTF